MKFFIKIFLIVFILFMLPVFCIAQNIVDTLDINITLNGKLIAKNGIILSKKVEFFQYLTNEKIKEIIRKEKGDSTFIRILFKKNHEVSIELENSKIYNIQITKSKVKLNSIKNLKQFIKLKYFCKPYLLGIYRNCGVNLQIICNKKCRLKIDPPRLGQGK